MEGRLHRLLAAALHPARTSLTSPDYSVNAKGEPPGAVGAGAHPGTPGTATRPTPSSKTAPDPKPGISTISNRTSGALND